MSNIKIMRDDRKGTGAALPIAKALNTVGRNLNGMRMEDGSNLQKFGNQIVIPSAVSVFSFSKFAFGFKISGATVTIMAGDWPLGDTEASMDDTPVTINQDGQYVGLEVDPVAKTISVIGPSTSKAVFLPGGGKFRTWLHQFNFTPGNPGSATLRRTHLGSLFMPGYFAQ